ncbi:MAG: hypothetical protein K2X34_12065, partial [Hyphomonadaceae bacterium]|nr:hypothetical protein [Hyphomonadaceae bacterium]
IVFPPSDEHHAQRCEQMRRWLAGKSYGEALKHEDLSRACAVFWAPSKRLIIVNARPAGPGAYEAAVEVALFGFAAA